MTNSGILMPSGGGGLMRYNEEYKSRLMLKPAHVVTIIIAIVVFVYALKLIYPIA
jgi:preprotein translocase subunit Sec61beta